MRHGAVGMGEIGGRLREPRQRRVEPAMKRVGAERGAAFEKIGEDLAVIGGRTLVMRAVGKNLPLELDVQQAQAERAPARRRRAIETGGGPKQRLHILDEVIAADVGLEMALEKSDLPRDARLDARTQRLRERLPPRQLLQQNDDAQRQRIAVPGVAQPIRGEGAAGVEPLCDDVGRCLVVEAFEIVHVMQRHAPQLIAAGAPVDAPAGHARVAREQAEDEIGALAQHGGRARRKQRLQRLRVRDGRRAARGARGKAGESSARREPQAREHARDRHMTSELHLA